MLFPKLFDKPPLGYCPGRTLRRVMAELPKSVVADAAGACRAVLTTADGSLKCDVRETLERHFLMHIVAVEFTVSVPAVAVPEARIRVGNTGVVSRTGVVCDAPAPYREAVRFLTDRIEGDSKLRSDLLRLDFSYCEIMGSDEGWTIRLAPYGGSEVVSTVPPFRRYIRLGRTQSEGLVMTLRRLRHVVAAA